MSLPKVGKLWVRLVEAPGNATFRPSVLPVKSFCLEHCYQHHRLGVTVLCTSQLRLSAGSECALCELGLTDPPCVLIYLSLKWEWKEAGEMAQSFGHW